MDHCVMFVTVPSAEVGERIAQALVEEKLAACVNRVPGLVSMYRWKGAIERDPEELLVIKTRRALMDEVSLRVKALHPYDVPEAVALPIVGGWPPYLGWLEAETKA